MDIIVTTQYKAFESEVTEMNEREIIENFLDKAEYETIIDEDMKEELNEYLEYYLIQKGNTK